MISHIKSYKRLVSIIGIILILGLKFADLHQLTHDIGVKNDCKVCLLAHSKIIGDEYLPADIPSFEPLPPLEIPNIVTTVLVEQHKPTLFFGRSLNKAPPVA